MKQYGAEPRLTEEMDQGSHRDLKTLLQNRSPVEYPRKVTIWRRVVGAAVRDLEPRSRSHTD